MKKIFIVIIGLVFSQFSSAQAPYALFSQDSLKFASANFEFPVVIDSTEEVAGITTFYLAPTFNFELDNPELDVFENYSFDTLQDNGIYWGIANWFGDNIQMDSLGNYTFQNRVGNNLEIRTRELLGQSWTIIEFDNGDFIEAKVDSILVGNAMDNLDTSKYISLTKMDSSLVVIPDGINDQFILIGENSGLVSSPGFYEYPFHKEFYQYAGGINDSMTIEGTNRYKVWNMEIGDEFHARKDNQYLGDVHKIKIVITDKLWDAQNQIFTYHKHIWNKSYGPIYDADGNYVMGYPVHESDIIEVIDLDDYTFLDSALYGININDYYIDSESNFLDYEPSSYSKAKMNVDLFHITKQLNNYYSNPFSWFFYANNTDPTYPNFLARFVEGCGGPYYNFQPMYLGEYYFEYFLTYYKKGDLTWGTPYNIGLEELSAESIDIYPNPMEGMTSIDLNKQYENIELQLVNVQGQIIYTEKFMNQAVIQIDLNASPGYYMLKMILNDRFVFTKSLIKK